MTAQDHSKNTTQAAQYIGMSKSFLEKRRVEGDGPKYIKFGRAVRYSIRDLEDYMISHKRGSTSE